MFNWFKSKNNESSKDRKKGLDEISRKLSESRRTTAEIRMLFEKIVEQYHEIEKYAQLTRIQSAALEAISDGMVITDPDGIIVWTNTAFNKMTGYAHDELIGKNASVLKSGLQSQEFYKDMWDTIMARKVWRGTIWNIRKNGEFYKEYMAIHPVVNGKINWFIALKQEITPEPGELKIQ